MLSKSEIKYIQSLSHKKFRDEERTFVVEGLKMADEVLASHSSQIKAVYATDQWVVKNGHKLGKNISVRVVEEYELQKISFLSKANDVLLVMDKPAELPFNPEMNSLILGLDQIQDPGNLGTIIRTCDWFGINSIVCSMDTVDAFNPKVVQSAMGSIFHISIIYQDLPGFLDAYPVYKPCVAVLDGQPFDAVVPDRNTMLVIGNESKGVSQAMKMRAAAKITIPKKGRAESLNAAVATAVILSGWCK
jgi:RNA methyltransferase, TrmH family